MRSVSVQSPVKVKQPAKGEPIVTVAVAFAETGFKSSGVAVTVTVLVTIELEKFLPDSVPAVIVNWHVQDALAAISFGVGQARVNPLPFLSSNTPNLSVPLTVKSSVIKKLVSWRSLAVKVILKVMSVGRSLLASLAGLAVLVSVKY